jgi:predicted nuclease of restriction endonuclease-like (RecB) superfamily
MSGFYLYKSLIDQIEWVLDRAKNHVYAQVNQTMVITYRTIGQYIVEYEQGGTHRADYWESLIRKLSVDLTQKFWRWFWYRNLQQIKKFYTMFPKVQTLSAQFTNLTWSHYVFIMGIKDENERKFYTIEANQARRSLRELRRQFDSALYERIVFSKDTEKVKELAEKWQIITTFTDAIKDPYILEFLWLKDETVYSESELEQAIISQISSFLLELGKWFSFVGRQQRISSWPDHRYVDLVFYHRFLKCFVLIDLKIGELKHQDIWQMQMYVNRYNREIKTDDEHPTIWIVLCKKKSEFVIEYTLTPEQQYIYAKEYQLYLPNKEQIKQLLEWYYKGN